jgi:hypothetical protein
MILMSIINKLVLLSNLKEFNNNKEETVEILNKSKSKDKSKRKRIIKSKKRNKNKRGKNYLKLIMLPIETISKYNLAILYSQPKITTTKRANQNTKETKSDSTKAWWN